MVWLLAAESRKLLRPLVWGAVLATVAFLLLLTWAATNNARSGLASPRVPDVCVGSTTPACERVIQRADSDALAAARDETTGAAWSCRSGRRWHACLAARPAADRSGFRRALGR